MMVWLPLTRMEAVHVEHALQRLLSLPLFVTVFSVVRSDEASYAPPMPLLLMHGLVDLRETRCDIDVRIRPTIQARPGLTIRPASLPPLPVASLASAESAVRTAAGWELFARLRRHGVARLRATPDLAACLERCRKESVPAFFAQPAATKAQLYCKLRPRTPTDNAYAGVGNDSGREWLQVRRRLDVGVGAGELDDVPCTCLPEGTPPTLAAGFDGLRQVAATCLGALAVAAGATAESWLSTTDLADQHSFRQPAPQADSAEARAGGPSVLRYFRYLPDGQGCGCHAHADLGLLTLDPAPTTAGMLVYDTEGLQWEAVEDGMGPDELTIFCGEQLSFLSGGRLPSPLHRVPAPPADGTPRISMPFFARAHPDALLVPMAVRARDEATAAAASSAIVAPGGVRRLAAQQRSTNLEPRRVEDFVIEQLFRRRPWRPNPGGGDSGTPDY